MDRPKRKRKAPDVYEATMRESRCHWTLADKEKLLDAIKKHGKDNLVKLERAMHSKKTKAQIAKYMHQLQSRNPAKSAPSLVSQEAPIETWLRLANSLTASTTDYSDVLADVFSICANLEPRLPKTNFKVVDYNAMYRYLECLLRGVDEPPKMNALSTAVLLDILQSLADTLKTLDLTIQRKLMSEKYKLLTDKVTVSNQQHHEAIRRALENDIELNGVLTSEMALYPHQILPPQEKKFSRWNKRPVTRTEPPFLNPAGVSLSKPLSMQPPESSAATEKANQLAAASGSTTAVPAFPAGAKRVKLLPGVQLAPGAYKLSEKDLQQLLKTIRPSGAINRPSFSPSQIPIILNAVSKTTANQSVHQAGVGPRLQRFPSPAVIGSLPRGANPVASATISSPANPGVCGVLPITAKPRLSGVPQGAANSGVSGILQSAAKPGLSGVLPTAAKPGVSGVLQNSANRQVSGILLSTANPAISEVLPSAANPGKSEILQNAANSGKSGILPSAANSGISGILPNATNPGVIEIMPSAANSVVSGTLPIDVNPGVTGILPNSANQGMTGILPNSAYSSLSETMPSAANPRVIEIMPIAEYPSVQSDANIVGMCGNMISGTNPEVMTENLPSGVNSTGNGNFQSDAKIEGMNENLQSAAKTEGMDGNMQSGATPGENGNSGVGGNMPNGANLGGMSENLQSDSNLGSVSAIMQSGAKSGGTMGDLQSNELQTDTGIIGFSEGMQTAAKSVQPNIGGPSAPVVSLNCEIQSGVKTIAANEGLLQSRNSANENPEEPGKSNTQNQSDMNAQGANQALPAAKPPMQNVVIDLERGNNLRTSAALAPQGNASQSSPMPIAGTSAGSIDLQILDKVVTSNSKNPGTAKNASTSNMLPRQTQLFSLNPLCIPVRYLKPLRKEDVIAAGMEPEPDTDC